eukprot:3417425-Amphidinium_carterae.1
MSVAMMGFYERFCRNSPKSLWFGWRSRVAMFDFFKSLQMELNHMRLSDSLENTNSQKHRRCQEMELRNEQTITTDS